MKKVECKADMKGHELTAAIEISETHAPMITIDVPTKSGETKAQTITVAQAATAGLVITEPQEAVDLWAAIIDRDNDAMEAAKPFIAKLQS